MNNYVVDIKVRVIVGADNPGQATSDTADKIRDMIDHAPYPLRTAKIEASAYPLVNLLRR